MADEEIPSEGYDDLTTYVIANWKYMEFQDSSGTAIVRREIGGGTLDPADPTWTDETRPVITASMTIEGTDTDLPAKPFTIAKAALFKAASGGNAMGLKTYDSTFTMTSDSDEFTGTIDVEIPQQE